jgi:hypothetical protein
LILFMRAFFQIFLTKEDRMNWDSCYKQIRECSSSTIILVHLSEFHLSEWLRKSLVGNFHTEMPIDLHVKSPLLLPSFSQNWNVSTNFSKTSQYKIL